MVIETQKLTTCSICNQLTTNPCSVNAVDNPCESVPLREIIAAPQVDYVRSRVGRITLSHRLRAMETPQRPLEQLVDQLNETPCVKVFMRRGLKLFPVGRSLAQHLHPGARDASGRATRRAMDFGMSGDEAEGHQLLERRLAPFHMHLHKATRIALALRGRVNLQLEYDSPLRIWMQSDYNLRNPAFRTRLLRNFSYSSSGRMTVAWVIQQLAKHNGIFQSQWGAQLSLTPMHVKLAFPLGEASMQSFITRMKALRFDQETQSSMDLDRSRLIELAVRIANSST